MSFKRIIIIIELCVLLVLAALTAVFGFNRGVWDRSTFFTKYTDDDLRHDEGWYIPNKTYGFYQMRQHQLHYTQQSVRQSTFLRLDSYE